MGERVLFVTRPERPFAPGVGVGDVARVALALGLFALSAPTCSAVVKGASALGDPRAVILATGFVAFHLTLVWVGLLWWVPQALALATRRYAVTTQRLLVAEGKVLGLFPRLTVAVAREGLVAQVEPGSDWVFRFEGVRVRGAAGREMLLERPEEARDLARAIAGAAAGEPG